MNTFLPYADFAASARCLDRARLGKQRVECLQILRVLLGKTVGWTNHPAVRMWRSYEACLVEYAFAVCDEWHHVRGYRDTVASSITDLAVTSPRVDPPWLGGEAFHASHRSNLLRKSAAHYGQFGWAEPPDLPYVWPIN